MRNEANEVVKPIMLTVEESGDEYTLEFSKESVIFTNRQGFKISEFQDNMEEMLPILWYGAFRMHHKNVSRQKTDKLLEDIGGLTSEAAERLIMLYGQPRKSLFRDEEEEPENPPKANLKLL